MWHIARPKSSHPDEVLGHAVHDELDLLPKANAIVECICKTGLPSDPPPNVTNLVGQMETTTKH